MACKMTLHSTTVRSSVGLPARPEIENLQQLVAPWSFATASSSGRIVVNDAPGLLLLMRTGIFNTAA